MRVFLLIIRILLILGVLAGIIIMSLSEKLAIRKKFGNEKIENHYRVKTKLIGFIISGIALAILLLIGLLS